MLRGRARPRVGGGDVDGIASLHELMWRLMSAMPDEASDGSEITPAIAKSIAFSLAGVRPWERLAPQFLSQRFRRRHRDGVAMGSDEAAVGFPDGHEEEPVHELHDADVVMLRSLRG